MIVICVISSASIYLQAPIVDAVRSDTGFETILHQSYGKTRSRACTAATSVDFICMGLAGKPKNCAVLTWVKTDHLLEGPRKVTLVIEAGSHGDFGERVIGLGNLAASEFNPEPADVFPGRTPEGLTKDASKMSRMNAYGVRNVCQAY